MLHFLVYNTHKLVKFKSQFFQNSNVALIKYFSVSVYIEHILGHNIYYFFWTTRLQTSSSIAKNIFRIPAIQATWEHHFSLNHFYEIPSSVNWTFLQVQV